MAQDTVASAVPIRVLVAETIGTFVLMIVGPGSAIVASDKIGDFGIALAFGFVLLAMAYAIGHVSGCHINPAVTLGFLLSRLISARDAAFYWVGQVVGAVLGGLVIWIYTKQGDLDTTGVFASNGWGSTLGSSYGLGSVAVVEIVFTALLIFVVLSTTTRGFPLGFGGLAAGITLGAIHLATIPVDNTSVNPARSLGTALFAGTDHLAQLWAFIVFPLIGGAVGFGIWRVLHPAEDMTGDI